MFKVLLLLAFSLSAFAYSVKTTVVNIEDIGDEKSLDVLVTYDGRIFNVKKEDTEIVEQLKIAQSVGAKVELELQTDIFSFSILNKLETIKKVSLLTENKKKEELVLDEVQEKVTPLDNYEATNLNSLDEAKALFKDLSNVGKTRRRSECFNRAYLWSKHMSDRHNVNSMKILVYFSKLYRKEIKRSKWWFHIAPMVKVNGELYAMDRKFMKEPVTAYDWEQYFTKKIPNRSYDCMKITHYSEFKKNYYNPNEWCMIQYTSMYYWEPNDIKAVEETGIPETRWKDSRVKAAAYEAFKKSEKVYEKYKL